MKRSLSLHKRLEAGKKCLSIQDFSRKMYWGKPVGGGKGGRGWGA